jgi:hypothetical protein
MSQHMDALKKANIIRLGRAQIKRDIHNSVVTTIDVLEAKPYDCDTMTVGELLCAQKRWAHRRTNKFLSEITPHLSENRQLKCLTLRERALLVKRLSEL